MSILAQCPICKVKQRVANKKCRCGEEMDKAKRSERVRYYIRWRMPGKLKEKGQGQKQEFVGYSITEAKASEGKRKAQKKEKPRVLEIDNDNKTTFADLAKWYTSLHTVKQLKTYERVVICINNFNKTFGKTLLCDITKSDLANYIDTRQAGGMKPASVDLEIRLAKQMVYAAFDDDRISGHALKMFNRLKKQDKKFTRGDNARTRLVSIDEYVRLLDAAEDFLKPIIEFGMNTGLRVESEILRLQWSRVKRKDGFLRLKAQDTKEGKPKRIPINHNVARILDNTVRHVHHDYVFTYRNEPVSKLSHFIACCKKAGIPYGYKTEGGLVFRDIRRTVKSTMVEAGVDVIYRDILLGHSKQGMDVYYVQVEDETLTKAMQKYTAWLDNELKCVDLSVDLENYFQAI
jgi:integrase